VTMRVGIRATLVGLVLLVANPCFGQSPSPFQSVPAPAPVVKPRPQAAPQREPDELPPTVTPAPAPAPVAPAKPVTPAYPFDGRYVGLSPGTSNLCRARQFAVTVSQGGAVGQATDGRMSWAVQGTVAADGSYTGTAAGQPMTGRFQGSAFQGAYQSQNPFCGARAITMQRLSPQ
jgi:hypothetical protein